MILSLDHLRAEVVIDEHGSAKFRLTAHNHGEPIRTFEAPLVETTVGEEG